METRRNLPTIQELSSNDILVANKQNELNLLLNQEPLPAWVKKHPMAKNVKYIPIERIEFLLTNIFQKWRVESKKVQLIANSIVVEIRLHYKDVLTGEWDWQDGIGAAPLQTDKDAGAIQFDRIKNDAVMKAAPAAESYAVKDAAEKLGKLFGKDLNRADVVHIADMRERFQASITTIQRCENMINNSTFTDDVKMRYENGLIDITEAEAERMIDELRINQQTDPVGNGKNYNQKDINKKLDQKEL